MQIIGKCHCGNLRFEFQTNLKAEELSIRACNCSFCRLHGAKSTSDPNGSVQFFVDCQEQLNRYQFGTKTADFLICKVCGVYLAAVMTVDEKKYSTFNLTTTPLRNREAQLVSYEHETQQERIERRLVRWTPVYGRD